MYSRAFYTCADDEEERTLSRPLDVDSQPSDLVARRVAIQRRRRRGLGQLEPARQLVNLTDIPVLFMNGEGGYHRIFDHCLANWLNQAGVQTEYVRMEDVGLPGNGHMMMLELNSKEIAEYIHGWLEENIL